MPKDDLFDSQKRSSRISHLVCDRGKEGIIDALTIILEKMEELETRIGKLEEVKPETKLKK